MPTNRIILASLLLLLGAQSFTTNAQAKDEQILGVWRIKQGVTASQLRREITVTQLNGTIYFNICNEYRVKGKPLGKPMGLGACTRQIAKPVANSTNETMVKYSDNSYLKFKGSQLFFGDRCGLIAEASPASNPWVSIKVYRRDNQPNATYNPRTGIWTIFSNSCP